MSGIGIMGFRLWGLREGLNAAASSTFDDVSWDLRMILGV